MKTNGKNTIKELLTWQEKLSHFLHENALLKYMLSEIVDENEEKNFLPVAEYFQNELLLKDEKLKSLLKQVNDLATNDYTMLDEIYDLKVNNLNKEISFFLNEYDLFYDDFKSKCYKKIHH